MTSPAAGAAPSAGRRTSAGPAAVGRWSAQGLLWAFAQRDFRTRYRTSAIGWTWSLLQPLANLAVFAVVFTLVFKVKPPPTGERRGQSYALFLFTGLVTWGLFAVLINLSMASLRESGPLLRKVAFPAGRRCWAPAWCS